MLCISLLFRCNPVDINGDRCVALFHSMNYFQMEVVLTVSGGET